MNDLKALTLEQLKCGYCYHEGVYTCQICNEKFYDGEIYAMNGRFFEAFKAIKQHMDHEHLAMIKVLLADECKYNTLTNHQIELLSRMADGCSDHEIAKELSITPSTVRNQRFQFREKAKQAKLYLAIYELAEVNFAKKKAEKIIDIHKGATMVDDRYVITEQEAEAILEKMFTSMDPLKLDHIPPKQKKKIIVLKRIAEEFEKEKHYSEKEVNEILKAIHSDFVTIRRYLIEYGYLDRSRDCKAYWVK